MKKALFIVAAIAMTFVACTKDEVRNGTKGMTLSANVDETKAIIEDQGNQTWKFLWNGGDEVGVTSPSGTPYTFVKPESGDFTCGEAVPEEGVWRAQYPASFTSFNFTQQSGELSDVMANYFMTGASENYESATAQISMTMEPKLAIIKVTNNTRAEINIQYMKNKDMFNTYFWLEFSSDGEVSQHSRTHNPEYYCGIIGVNETKYYLAPAKQVTMWVNEAQYGTAKTLAAGHIYNLVVK